MVYFESEEPDENKKLQLLRHLTRQQHFKSSIQHALLRSPSFASPRFGVGSGMPAFVEKKPEGLGKLSTLFFFGFRYFSPFEAGD